jgi:GNAT superfamily N-acetyltransferase
LLYESFVEFEPRYTTGGFTATTPGAGQILVRMSEGPVWVAARGGELVGTVSAVLKDASAYIRGMAVVPAARGSGAGSKLLQQVESWAAGEGCERLFLSTTPFLDAAIRLYEKSGFRRTGENPHDLFGTPLFTMEKKVSRKT